MERVAFLIEQSNVRISALLNPDRLVMRRVAGVRPRYAIGGQVIGRGQSDDPLHYTGGGRTELDLDLLFDVSLADPNQSVRDVRALTRPLWELAENSSAQNRPPTVRFVWGKVWNIPGVVVAVSERLEYFDVLGVPRRSWLRLRMIRTQDDRSEIQPARPVPLDAIQNVPIPDPTPADTVYEVRGSGAAAERLDEIADRFYGDVSLWRFLARVNNITDPFNLEPGTRLRIPSRPEAFA